MPCVMPLIDRWSWLCFAGSRLQSRIGAHKVRGLDAETTPFCFRHLSTSDLAEDACDGNFNAGKIPRSVNRHLILPDRTLHRSSRRAIYRHSCISKASWASVDPLQDFLCR